ncbi:carbohydrate porin [Pontiella agarivorans]|uniref:Carbohydrate porin n=1 Tax=Pontiella agarivorans TaxID=3038953 RepID=A0ABU5MW34_9BACT|nr:carbohydrate porin [Pontiella agarivorans]MDZ8118333.1 carbohydrate porin [Pontiella agarivorans]
MKKSVLLLSAAVSASAVAEQGPQEKAWYQEDRLFDRYESMEASGISPFLYFDSIYAANVDGGVDTADNYTAQTYAGVDLDLEKLIGWDNTTMKISMVNRSGNGIANDVGGIYDPMCINGGPDGQVTWLYQVWIEKMFGENLAVKFGRTSMDEDFADNGLNRYALSTAINGPIRSMMLESPQIYSFPLALWGGRLKYTLNENHQFQLGAYQINASIWDDYVPGTDWSWRSDDGVTFMAQYDWTPAVFERPSRFYLGIADSVYEYDDFDGGETSNLLRFYGHAEVEVVENLRLFAFGAYTTQDETAKVPLQLSGGANWKGLIPGRENDHTMCFVTYGQISDEYGEYVTLDDVDAEMVYEFGHRIQIIPSFYIQPSVQYIVDPGGGTNGDVDNALVLGAWVGAAF